MAVSPSETAMTLSMHAASVPVFKQMLTSLGDVLSKAEAHATEKKIDPAVLLQTRLFPDMFPLVRQVQIACDFAKSVPARLAGADVPAYDDSEQSFAELQARNRKQMFMADWIVKLDQFLAISDRAVLTGAGRISAKVAKSKADKEYGRWHARMIDAPSAVEQHFLEVTRAAKRIEAARPKKPDGGKRDD